MFSRFLWCLVVTSAFGSIRGDGDVFTKVADTSTVAPGTARRFFSFAGEPGNEFPVDPSLDNGYVTFTAHSNQFGVYLWYDGVLSTIADYTTPVPNGSGTFTAFRTPSASGSNVAFRGFSNGNRDEGVYLSAGGSLQRVADPATTLPGNGKFVAASLTPIGGTDVYFENEGQGVYRFHDGALSVVADVHTPIPGGTGNFSSLNSDLAGRNGNIAFFAVGANRASGIYAFTGGSLVRVADTTTPLPGGSGHFLGFNNIAIGSNENTVAFEALDGSSNWGIYASTDGVIRKITDSQIPEDQINGLLLSVGDGHLAYEANGVIYSDLSGTLRRTVGPGDVILGRTVDGVGMGPDALSGNQIVFSATFRDGSSGIYLVPEPSSLATIALGALGVLAGRRRR